MSGLLWVILLSAPYLYMTHQFSQKVQEVPELKWEQIKVPTIFLFVSILPLGFYLGLISLPKPLTISQFNAVAGVISTMLFFGILGTGGQLMVEARRRRIANKEKKKGA